MIGDLTFLGMTGGLETVVVTHHVADRVALLRVSARFTPPAVPTRECVSVTS